MKTRLNGTIFVMLALMSASVYGQDPQTTAHKQLIHRIQNESLTIEGAMEEVLDQIVATSDETVLELLLSSTSYGVRLDALQKLRSYPEAWQKKALVLVLRSPKAFKKYMWSEAAIGREAYVDLIVDELARFSVRVLASDLENENIRLNIAADLSGELRPKSINQSNAPDQSQDAIKSHAVTNGESAQETAARHEGAGTDNHRGFSWITLAVAAVISGTLGLLWLFLLKKRP